VPNAEAEQAYARGDYATAFKIWFALAEQGSPQAQRNIAGMYERGEWVVQDSQAAREWYDRAAAQSGRDAAMPRAPGGPATVRAGPAATGPGYPPPAYPRQASYPAPYLAPSPAYMPTRPIIVPIFRVHRRHH